MHPRFMERICKGEGASIRHPSIKAADAAKLFDELPGVSWSATYYSSGLQWLLMGHAPILITIGDEIAGLLEALGLKRLPERTATNLIDYDCSAGYFRGDSSRILTMVREQGFWKIAYSDGPLILRLQTLALWYLEAFLARKLSVAEQVIPCAEALLRGREMVGVFGSDRTMIRRAFEQNIVALGCIRTLPTEATLRSSRFVGGVVLTTQAAQEWQQRLRAYRASWRAAKEVARRLPPIELQVERCAQSSDSNLDPGAGSSSTA